MTHSKTSSKHRAFAIGNVYNQDGKKMICPIDFNPCDEYDCNREWRCKRLKRVAEFEPDTSAE